MLVRIVVLGGAACEGHHDRLQSSADDCMRVDPVRCLEGLRQVGIPLQAHRVVHLLPHLRHHVGDESLALADHLIDRERGEVDAHVYGDDHRAAFNAGALHLHASEGSE